MAFVEGLTQNTDWKNYFQFPVWSLDQAQNEQRFVRPAF